MKWHGLVIGLSAALVLLLGGCVQMNKAGPGGRAMMDHHYAVEAGKVVSAMANPGAQPAEAAPPVEPAPAPES